MFKRLAVNLSVDGFNLLPAVEPCSATEQMPSNAPPNAPDSVLTNRDEKTPWERGKMQMNCLI
jgi:hypothetical protein